VARLKFERYGIGIAKGMALTFKHLFRPPITILYPEEKLITSQRIRGIGLVWFPENCRACALCSQACPHGNIELVTHKAEKGRAVDVFNVDEGRCMFCGLCVEACPFNALAMSTDYEKAEYSRDNMTLSKEQLPPSDKRQPSGYRRPEFAARLPKQTLLVYWDKLRSEGGQKLSMLPLSKKRGRGA